MPRRGHRVPAAVLVAALSCALLVARPGQAASTDRDPVTLERAHVARCSTGLVALTFDDGPSSAVTARLVASLRELDVPATFFMVGARVASAPATARLVARNGYQIANHSYHHELMTAQSSAAIRATLRATARGLRRAGVVPSGLMRPPYGGIDARVQGVISSVGLVPVLWDVDPRDWAGGSSATIASSVLAQLRPHQRNIVLQHDGVANSPASVAAVSTIVRTARARGYCFAALGADGDPVAPRPHARLLRAAVSEGRSARVVVRLDRPTSRPTRVRLSTADGSATAGRDYAARQLWVRFPVGATSAEARIPVRTDRVDEPEETFRVRLSQPLGLSIDSGTRTVVIHDLNPPAGLRVQDLRVREPATGSVTADVVVSLGGASGRPVRVTLETRPGTAGDTDFTPVLRTLRFAPGTVTRTLSVTVLADLEDESPESFTVVVTDAVHATVVRGSATVTIDPPG